MSEIAILFMLLDHFFFKYIIINYSILITYVVLSICFWYSRNYIHFEKKKCNMQYKKKIGTGIIYLCALNSMYFLEIFEHILATIKKSYLN